MVHSIMYEGQSNENDLPFIVLTVYVNWYYLNFIESVVCCAGSVVRVTFAGGK